MAADGLLGALADAIGPRWRLMVNVAAYGPARPEEQAATRRRDVDPENVGVWVRIAEPELTTGRRAPGDTKSEAGRRFPVLPAFMEQDLRRHLAWYAEEGSDGLLFVGEKGHVTLKDTMVRAGQSSERAALIYQHSNLERQKEAAGGIDTRVRA